MKDKKLSYSVHVKGELVKAMSCPVGTYYLDIKHELYFFEPKEGVEREHALAIATGISVLAAHRGIKNGKVVAAIHERYAHLPEKHVKKDGDKYLYDFYIQGEMDAYVTEDTLGILYGDQENEVYFFDSKYKGFMEPILKKKFFDGIAKDLESKEAERRAAAIAVEEIKHDWTELDENDIVR
jgi:hypothetical protein